MLTICPNCRSKVVGESRFCMECGTQLRMRNDLPGAAPSFRVRLNCRQKYSMWAGIILVAFVGLHPPWKEIRVFKDRPKMERQIGYHSILEPPADNTSSRNNHLMYEIDFERLGVIWAIVAVFMGGLIVTFGDDMPLGKSAFNVFRNWRKLVR